MIEFTPLDDAGLVPLGDVVLEAIAFGAGELDQVVDRIAESLDVDALDVGLVVDLESLDVAGAPFLADDNLDVGR